MADLNMSINCSFLKMSYEEFKIKNIDRFIIIIQFHEEMVLFYELEELYNESEDLIIIGYYFQLLKELKDEKSN